MKIKESSLEEGAPQQRPRGEGWNWTLGLKNSVFQEEGLALSPPSLITPTAGTYDLGRQQVYFHLSTLQCSAQRIKNLLKAINLHRKNRCIGVRPH